MEISDSALDFQSSDDALAAGFRWAKQRALSYVFQGDPVGDWYEAALPGRQSFCMRDVAHQATGARCLWLAPVTRNMFHAFARNVSETRDWCTYWEIDRTGAPCSADYRDDSYFWYNLPASFDVLQACVREYLWTGDRAYIDDPAFRYFFEATVSGYVGRWDRDGDGIPEHHPEDGFRGLGSYNEGAHGRSAMIGADLIALQHAGFLSYAAIMGWRGNRGQADALHARARSLRETYNERWWDRPRERFHSLMLPGGAFAEEYIPESQVFPLLCRLTEDGRKTDRTLDESIAAARPNVEARSYLPEAWFMYGRNEDAAAELRALMAPGLDRRDYPEVSFAAVGSLVVGLMGVDADAREQIVTTLPRLPRDVGWASIQALPVFDNHIAIRHDSVRQTTFENVSGPPLFWKAAFPVRTADLVVDGRRTPAATGVGLNRQDSSWVFVRVEPGERHSVELCPEPDPAIMRQPALDRPPHGCR